MPQQAIRYEISSKCTKDTVCLITVLKWTHPLMMTIICQVSSYVISSELIWYECQAAWKLILYRILLVAFSGFVTGVNYWWAKLGTQYWLLIHLHLLHEEHSVVVHLYTMWRCVSVIDLVNIWTSNSYAVSIGGTSRQRKQEDNRSLQGMPGDAEKTRYAGGEVIATKHMTACRLIEMDQFKL